jgi:hypothetical protein
MDEQALSLPVSSGIATHLARLQCEEICVI